MTIPTPEQRYRRALLAIVSAKLAPAVRLRQIANEALHPEKPKKLKAAEMRGGKA